MFVVRAVSESDIDPLYDLIQKSELGLTTLAVSREILRQRIELSRFAFAQSSAAPNGQPYVFVMEDLTSGEIVGTSAVYSKVGGFEPFYTYEIKKSVHASEQLNIHKEIDVLHLSMEHNGPSEIGSLFLSPDYWGKGHGRLLSIARFLFMASFLERFEKQTIAELRGVVDRDGHSPFWDAIGSFFFQIDFPRAETLTSQSKKFIADLMPQHPIYIPLLPQPAQDVIGKVHQNTVPAQALLGSEGFNFLNQVDIFDGGPTVQCETSQIRAIRESRSATISRIIQADGKPEQLISNASLQYRACLGVIRFTEPGQCEIDANTALRLDVKVGQLVNAVPLKPTNPMATDNVVEKKNVDAE